jgi:hypothetical protein
MAHDCCRSPKNYRFGDSFRVINGFFQSFNSAKLRERERLRFDRMRYSMIFITYCTGARPWIVQTVRGSTWNTTSDASERARLIRMIDPCQVDSVTRLADQATNKGKAARATKSRAADSPVIKLFRRVPNFHFERGIRQHHDFVNIRNVRSRTSPNFHRACLSRVLFNSQSSCRSNGGIPV